MELKSVMKKNLGILRKSCDQSLKVKKVMSAGNKVVSLVFCHFFIQFLLCFIYSLRVIQLLELWSVKL